MSTPLRLLCLLAAFALPALAQDSPKCFEDPTCSGHDDAPPFDAGFGRAFNTLTRHVKDESLWLSGMGVADPVFPASLEFRLNRIDLKVTSLGPDLVHERSWRSMNDYDGPFG
ncbi:MAG TPA: hypothetical protein ENK43_02985, partial [Planctomycetes bacterium]|nr:hypothetical protein [Planctomycetota bacterium]